MITLIQLFDVAGNGFFVNPQHIVAINVESRSLVLINHTITLLQSRLEEFVAKLKSSGQAKIIND